MDISGQIVRESQTPKKKKKKKDLAFRILLRDETQNPRVPRRISFYRGFH